MGPFFLVSALVEGGEVVEVGVADQQPLDPHDPLPFPDLAPVRKLRLQVRPVHQPREPDEHVPLQDREEEVDGGAAVVTFAELLVVEEGAGPHAVLRGLVQVVALLAADDEELAVLQRAGVQLLVEVRERGEGRAQLGLVGVVGRGLEGHRVVLALRLRGARQRC